MKQYFINQCSDLRNALRKTDTTQRALSQRSSQTLPVFPLESSRLVMLLQVHNSSRGEVF